MNKNQSKLLQNVLLVNGSSEVSAPNNGFLNKNLYVEFLASLYKQNKIQKATEELNIAKLFPTNSPMTPPESFPFPLLKKENSSTNNGSFSHQEEGQDSDGLSNSNENMKSKSKKM